MWKIQQMNLDIFSNQNMLKSIDCVLLYSNRYAASRGFKAKRYYLSKGVINNYKVIINEKNFYDQPIDSDIKKHKYEDYTTACLVSSSVLKGIRRRGVRKAERRYMVKNF